MDNCTGTFVSGPIFFEFTVELVYPVPEGVVGGFLTCVYNAVGMIFLFSFYIPGIGKLVFQFKGVRQRGPIFGTTKTSVCFQKIHNQCLCHASRLRALERYRVSSKTLQGAQTRTFLGGKKENNSLPHEG